jgi:hypothetical protein
MRFLPWPRGAAVEIPERDEALGGSVEDTTSTLGVVVRF